MVIKLQTEMILKNIMAILNKANLDKKHIVKLNVFLINLKTLKKSIKLLNLSFMIILTQLEQPIEVSRLPMDALVEIDCIACLDA